MIVSIDLGVTGALARHAKGGALDSVEDLAVADGVILPWSLRAQIDGCDAVIIEKVHAMPTGSKANFSMGTHLGLVLGVAGTLGIPVLQISPSAWKRTMGLTRPGKEGKSQARALASQLYPEHAEMFVRVRDHDRAEAVLIGRAWMTKQ